MLYLWVNWSNWDINKNKREVMGEFVTLKTASSVLGGGGTDDKDYLTKEDLTSKFSNIDTDKLSGYETKEYVDNGDVKKKQTTTPSKPEPPYKYKIHFTFNVEGSYADNLTHYLSGSDELYFAFTTSGEGYHPHEQTVTNNHIVVTGTLTDDKLRIVFAPIFLENESECEFKWTDTSTLEHLNRGFRAERSNGVQKAILDITFLDTSKIVSDDGVIYLGDTEWGDTLQLNTPL